MTTTTTTWIPPSPPLENDDDDDDDDCYSTSTCRTENNRTRTSSEELFRQTLSPYSELLPTIHSACQKSTLLRSQSLPMDNKNHTTTMLYPKTKKQRSSSSIFGQPSLPFLWEHENHYETPHDQPQLRYSKLILQPQKQTQLLFKSKSSTKRPRSPPTYNSVVPLYVSHVYPEISMVVHASREEYSRCKLPPTSTKNTTRFTSQQEQLWLHGSRRGAVPTFEKADSSRLLGLDFIED